MSELSLFLKENKRKKENAFFPVTKSLLCKDGNPLLWEIRPVTTREDEKIREECTHFDTGSGRFRLDVNSYLAKITAAAVVQPNLYNANLQNSYEVSTPEELIREMVDDPHEYQALAKLVQQFGDAAVPMTERIEQAKN
jgi:hypothetical protein